MKLQYLTFFLVAKKTYSFTIGKSQSLSKTHDTFLNPPLYSTPFDASFYDDDEDSPNPFTTDINSLAVPPSTNIVLGLNKYSHDTTICAADASTGKVLFAMAKERLTRKKHDSGNVASLVELCLDQLELDLDNVVKVVVNNHHHRVLPMERSLDHLEWEVGMGINGGVESGYSDEENLLFEADQTEISHHLAHAYSAACQSPFNEGLVMIMDGMGETYRTMRAAIETNDDKYVSDLLFEGEYECIPRDIREKSQTSVFDWREAESAYEFKKTSDGISVKPVFKRFTQENTPPALYNHGFENMDSAGALYSRASSHIFGDWNACGKVMGLAPWMGHEWDVAGGSGERITAGKLEHEILQGKLYKEGDAQVKIDRSYMMRTPIFARNDPDLFDNEGNMIRTKRYDFDDNDTESDNDYTKKLPTNAALDAISLAYRMQVDLESVMMDLVKHCKTMTGQENLCIAGGVGLNSVLNGRLSRELGFKNVFIPPYPGDDGIAFGCCAYGLFGNLALKKDGAESTPTPKLWTQPISPYLGPDYSYEEIRNAIEAASPWLDVELVANDKRRYEIMSQEIETGGVIAWFQGRSEVGPRALGHRSILADPRKKGLVRFINESVKKRESFRPFAPSCLSEEAANWFDLGDDLFDTSNISPYMSMTAMVKNEKREYIPAVTHVDGSSRLQTVTEEGEPSYHAFISTFFKRTGVPMVLNTSFNTIPSEPIVESPSNAIRSFLSSMGSIEMLVMGDYVIKRKDADVRRLLGEMAKDGVLLPATNPKRAGPANYESKFVVAGDEGVTPSTRVFMPDRPMHDDRSGGWYDLLDELEGELLGVCNGKVSVNDIMNQYLVSAEGQVGDEVNNTEYQEILFGNIIRRLIRLYEHTLISW
jgi:predicted NodU family carbamoyl transferase